MAKRPRKEMSGFLDFFRPKKIFEAFSPRPSEPEGSPLPALPAPWPPEGTIIPRPEQLPSPVKPSIFEFAAPKPEVQEPEPPPSWFSGMKPEPPPPAPEPPPAAPEQASFWNQMFTPEEEARPVAEMFGQVQRTPARPPRWVPISVYQQTINWQGIWPFPTIEQLVATLRRNLDLNKIFRDLQASRETLEFWREMEKSARHGAPVLLRIEPPIVYKELYTDLARFFGISQDVFHAYMESARTLEEEREAFGRLWTEVISPLIFAMQEAFETITPANLPGWFTIVVDERTGEYWLYYVEAYMPPPPPPGLPYTGGPE